MAVSKHIRTYGNRLISYSLCLVLVGSFPLSVYADAPAEVPTETVVSTEPVDTSNPPESPAPATIVPDTNNEPAPTTQVVETPSEPTKTSTVTTEAEPSELTEANKGEEEPEKNYYFDPTTQRWNTDAWVYDPVSGAYKEAPKPVVITPTDDEDVIDEKEDSISEIDAKTTTDIANALDSLAETGDATVAGNTKAGSATTGDASAVARVINNVNSTLTNANNKEAATFVSDVMGDVNGDLILQPMLLKAMLEANAVNTAQDQTIKSENDTDITNDINLTANSGDASVEKNTSAGDATSGDANTVADVVNIVNSMISANQSFMGTVNIYGNLNGDILIAPGFLSQLLAENSGGATLASTQNQSQTVNVDNTQNIVNNVALAAESGKAAVAGNTSAGSAASGDADTNVVLFNLSGHDIVASNSMLVFVNVLGKWVGVIVDAPTGATAAAIGNGVVQNSVTSSPAMTINAVNDTNITNNINLASRSGDATVAGNSFAGNATSGNATASANIANITNSQLGLSGWFGVLFINVFGTWVGSFGTDTSAGDLIIPTTVNSPLATTGAATTSSKQPLRVLTYVPRAGSVQPIVNTTVVTPAGAQTNATQAASVKAAQVFSSPYEITGTKTIEQGGIDVPFTIGSLMLALVSLYGLRKFLF